MAKLHPIYVRLPDGERLISWEPSSSDTQIRDLIYLLESDPHLADAHNIGLVEELSGQPVGPEVAATSLRGGILAVKIDAAGHAIRQLDIFRSQSLGRFDYELLHGSHVVGLKLRYPGMVRLAINGPGRIFVRSDHQALMVLPSAFPEKPPRLIWRTPIFHPNLLMEGQVWPPDFRWRDTPSMLMLMGALVDALVGLRLKTERRFRFNKTQTLNSEASSWYRKHMEAIIRLGEGFAYALGNKYETLPLVSSGTSWRLNGSLTGGSPIVFLSDRSFDYFVEFGRHSLGWLLGQRGNWGESQWFYIDRIVPSRGFKGEASPDTAIGVLCDLDVECKLSVADIDGRLITQVRGGQLLLQSDREGQKLTGYLVRSEGSDSAAATERAPSAPPGSIISIKAQTPTRTRSERYETLIDTSGVERTDLGYGRGSKLTEQPLEPPVCTYCGTVCFPWEEWGSCVHCGFAIHEECLDQLGGCPYTECPRSPLYVRKSTIRDSHRGLSLLGRSTW